MPRYLTGIQSSGKPHLGNILGAIEPALELARNAPPAFFFIADLHTLTSCKDPKLLRENTFEVAAAWLACGLDVQKDVFYRQSQIPEVCELAWYLNCFAPYPMLANAHSFKDKASQLSSVNAGLFVYPMLMAADILLYDAQVVPVGKDQKQHLEMTRDVAEAFNRAMGPTFVVPEVYIREEVMTIPGVDGRKMSKSYGNAIHVFDDEKALRKRIMSIVTDATPLEAPKNPDACTVFALYKAVAPAEETEWMRRRYLEGGYGYGQAKQALFERIMERFGPARERFKYYVENPQIVEELLRAGEDKAREVARPV
ncbi:MAG: tryptophan--tRNA ligase, partial [Bacteroidia bacterium]|nr:tryptophan--tRNA ligase [Bacteroidia bacterium]